MPYNREVRLGYLSALLAAVFFGSVSTVAKPTLESIHPLVLAFMVYFMASLVSTPFARSPLQSVKKNDWLLLLFIAVSGAVLGPSFFFLGLETSTASDTALLGNGEIIFSVILAIIFFREKLRRLGVLAVGMVIVGMFIVTTDLEISESLLNPDNLGNLAILVATAFWALDNNLSKILSKKINLVRIIQLKSAIGGAILLAVVIVLEIPLEITLEQVPSILFLGGAGFGLSIYLFLHGLKRIGTVRTIMLFSTSSVFGMFFAFIFLNENISMFQVLAVIIMISGIYLLHRDDRFLKMEKLQ